VHHYLSRAFRPGLVLGAIAVVGLAGRSAFASISGFGDGSNYTLTGYTQDPLGNIIDTNPPTISSGDLTLTTSSMGEARAAFYNTPQAVGSFTAQFVFQNSDQQGGSADGFSFVLQNDSRGTSAIGGGGAGLGYGLQNNNEPPTGPPLQAITPSAAIEFYLRNGTGAIEYDTDGAADFGSATPTGAVDLVDGDPILVQLSYDGSSLSETLTDETTSDVYSASFPADIVGAVGGSTAYVGFTGGTGGGYSQQDITDFSFDSVPEPASLALLGIAPAMLLRRRRAKTSRVR
jgi:hypothetical protein